MVQTCYICESSENNELELGLFMSCKGITVHYFCLLLTSTLGQNGEDSEGILGFLRKDIVEAKKRIKPLTCYYCKQKSANIQCASSKCYKSFHTACGLGNCVYQFVDQFLSYCHIHNFISHDKIHEENEICLICHEKLGRYHPITSVQPDCCKSGWFHKTCIANFARTAGYFFKCPLCNNDEIFRNCVINHGVYIPDRDAAWELEPNAYSELMERVNECQAPLCCFKSRANNVVLCDSCGSFAAHEKCWSQINSKNKFTCLTCESIDLNSRKQTANQKQKTSYSTSNYNSDVNEMECNPENTAARNISSYSKLTREANDSYKRSSNNTSYIQGTYLNIKQTDSSSESSDPLFKYSVRYSHSESSVFDEVSTYNLRTRNQHAADANNNFNRYYPMRNRTQTKRNLQTIYVECSDNAIQCEVPCSSKDVQYNSTFNESLGYTKLLSEKNLSASACSEHSNNYVVNTDRMSNKNMNDTYEIVSLNKPSSPGSVTSNETRDIKNINKNRFKRISTSSKEESVSNKDNSRQKTASNLSAFNDDLTSSSITGKNSSSKQFEIKLKEIASDSSSSSEPIINKCIKLRRSNRLSVTSSEENCSYKNDRFYDSNKVLQELYSSKNSSHKESSSNQKQTARASNSNEDISSPFIKEKIPPSVSSEPISNRNIKLQRSNRLSFASSGEEHCSYKNDGVGGSNMSKNLNKSNHPLHKELSASTIHNDTSMTLSKPKKDFSSTSVREKSPFLKRQSSSDSLASSESILNRNIPLRRSNRLPTVSSSEEQCSYKNDPFDGSNNKGQLKKLHNSAQQSSNEELSASTIHKNTSMTLSKPNKDFSSTSVKEKSPLLKRQSSSESLASSEPILNRNMPLRRSNRLPTVSSSEEQCSYKNDPFDGSNNTEGQLKKMNYSEQQSSNEELSASTIHKDTSMTLSKPKKDFSSTSVREKSPFLKRQSSSDSLASSESILNRNIPLRRSNRLPTVSSSEEQCSYKNDPFDGSNNKGQLKKLHNSAQQSSNEELSASTIHKNTSMTLSKPYKDFSSTSVKEKSPLLKRQSSSESLASSEPILNRNMPLRRSNRLPTVSSSEEQCSYKNDPFDGSNNTEGQIKKMVYSEQQSSNEEPSTIHKDTSMTLSKPNKVFSSTSLKEKSPLLKRQSSSDSIASSEPILNRNMPLRRSNRLPTVSSSEEQCSYKNDTFGGSNNKEGQLKKLDNSPNSSNEEPTSSENISRTLKREYSVGSQPMSSRGIKRCKSSDEFNSINNNPPPTKRRRDSKMYLSSRDDPKVSTRDKTLTKPRRLTKRHTTFYPTIILSDSSDCSVDGISSNNFQRSKENSSFSGNNSSVKSNDQKTSSTSTSFFPIFKSNYPSSTSISNESNTSERHENISDSSFGSSPFSNSSTDVTTAEDYHRIKTFRKTTKTTIYRSSRKTIVKVNKYKKTYDGATNSIYNYFKRL